MKFQNSIAVLMAGLMTITGGIFTSCEEDEDLSTNQIKSGVSLNAAQLQVTRGAYMQFKGTGLDQIQTIIFPGNVTVSEIEVVDKYTIRCIVPEEAVVGKVALCYGDKVIETSEIAFTEPIEVSEVTPKSVKPGDVITIKGRYFEIFTDVYFATGDAVAITPTRNEVKVVVPVDASTGEMVLSYVTQVDGENILNQLPVEEIEVAMPTVTEVTGESFKTGSTVTIKGTLLNMVEAVRFNGSENDTLPKAENPLTEKKELSVKIPASAVDGEITLVLHSGLEIKTPAVTIVKPEVAIKDAAASYGVGDKVVIAGTNIDLVKQVAFTGDTATDVKFNEAGEIEVEVTAAAQSGDITLTLNNGTTIAVSGFVTTKPSVTMPTSVGQLTEATFESTLASRVVKVFFGDLEVEAVASETSFKVSVPLEATTGMFSVGMDNGEKVEIGELTVDMATACVIVKDENGENVSAGSLYVVEVANEDKLTGVKINGEPVQYILSGTTLYISTNSKTMGGSTNLTLVSGSDEANFKIFLIPFGKVETTIMSGPVALDWKAPGQVYVPAASFADVPVGSIMKLYIMDTDGAWGQAQLLNGTWSAIRFDEVLAANAGTDKDGDLTFIPSNVAAFDWWNVKNTERVFEIKLTAAALAEFASKADGNGNGFIIQGQNLILSKITIEIDYSAPTSIVLPTGTDAGGWTLPVALSWGDGGRLVVYKDNPVDLSSKVKVGATLCIVTTNRHGQCQINDKDWSAIETVSDWSNEGEYVYEIPITQAYVDAFNKEGNQWLIIQGDSGFTISDMYIK